MITLQNVSKSYGKKLLFCDLSLAINAGEKIGLIGPNGAGKSTLFALVLGEAEPSSGTVKVNKNVRIGYLPQEASFKSDRTVLGEVTLGDQHVMRLQKEREDLEAANQADSARYGEVMHELETQGIFELEHKAEKILSGLGFRENDFHRPIRELSGGWQMRCLLAKLLVFHYDLLLLDEPTNYLDLNAALWLKDHLAGFDGTFVIISHDKAFLNEVTNFTLVLESGSLFKVKGNYGHYEAIKHQRRTHLEKQYKEQEKKRKQLEEFVSRFHAQPNKAAAVRAKRTILERIEKDPVVLAPDPRESIRSFRFPPAKQGGQRVISLEKISKSYGDTVVYRDFDFEIVRGEKAVLAGENGAGKSTLLKILAGVLEVDGGRRMIGYNTETGYFSQTRMDVLNPDNTVLREAYSAAPGYMPESTVRTVLGAFLFTGDDADKPVRVLSGGEKSRLILAKLLINPPNFLLLDEPTTHLDVDAVDALIHALKEYEGSLVFISHDIHFVRSVANVVYEVKNGTVRKFPGPFDYYLEKRDASLVPAPLAPKRLPEEKKKADDQRQKARDQEKLRRDAEKKRKSHNAALRESITKLEKEKEKIELERYAKARALSDPHIFRDEETVRSYGRRLKEIDRQCEEISRRIQELEGMIIRE